MGCRRPGTALPSGAAGAREEEAAAESESKECPVPDKCCLLEPCQRPGEPGPTSMVHPVSEGMVLQGHLSPVLSQTGASTPGAPSGSDPSSVTPPGQAGALQDLQAAGSPRHPEGRQRGGRGAQSRLQSDLSQRSQSRGWLPRRHGGISAGRWHKRGVAPSATAEHPSAWCHW